MTLEVIGEQLGLRSLADGQRIIERTLKDMRGRLQSLEPATSNQQRLDLLRDSSLWVENGVS